MFQRKFKVGDWVVYRVTKRSTNPGPRAQNIEPAPRGESYAYQVDKYWAVEAIDGDQVILRTRRGKTHTLGQSDPMLRHARWWEKQFLGYRFPRITGD